MNKELKPRLRPMEGDYAKAYQRGDAEAVKERVEDALAMMREPGFDNDGGPADIGEVLDSYRYNLNVWASESMEYYRRVEELENTFKHMHANNGENDACKKCGLDLRDPIHERIGERSNNDSRPSGKESETPCQ